MKKLTGCALLLLIGCGPELAPYERAPGERMRSDEACTNTNMTLEGTLYCEHFLIPKGTTRTTGNDLVIKAEIIEIAGTLQGRHGSHSTASDGGSIELIAESWIWIPGEVRGGDGFSPGPVSVTYQTSGVAGGVGGNVTLSSGTYTIIDGTVAAGAGGSGQSVRVITDKSASATGGAGGEGGALTVGVGWDLSITGEARAGSGSFSGIALAIIARDGETQYLDPVDEDEEAEKEEAETEETEAEEEELDESNGWGGEIPESTASPTIAPIQDSRAYAAGSKGGDGGNVTITLSHDSTLHFYTHTKGRVPALKAGNGGQTSEVAALGGWSSEATMQTAGSGGNITMLTEISSDLDISADLDASGKTLIVPGESYGSLGSTRTPISTAAAWSQAEASSGSGGDGGTARVFGDEWSGDGGHSGTAVASIPKTPESTIGEAAKGSKGGSAVSASAP